MYLLLSLFRLKMNMEVTLLATLITFVTCRIFSASTLGMKWCFLPQMVQAKVSCGVELFKAFIQLWILDQVGGHPKFAHVLGNKDLGHSGVHFQGTV